MLWRRKPTTFFHRPGLVDFTWIFIFATAALAARSSDCGCVRRVLRRAVPAKTAGHASHSVLHTHTSRVRACRLLRTPCCQEAAR